MLARPVPRPIARQRPADDGLGRDLADALAGGLKQLPDLSVISPGAVSDATALDAAAALSLIRVSSRSATSECSLRKAFTFSRPWPRPVSSKE